MMKYQFSDEEKQRIIEVYETGELSISALARELGLRSRTPIKSFAKSLGYDAPKVRCNSSGIKFEWTEDRLNLLRDYYKSPYHTVEELCIKLGIGDDVVHKKAKELGLKKVRKQKLTEEQVKLIRELSEGTPVTHLARKFKVSEETITKALGGLRLKRKEYYRPTKIENVEEFFKDLGNPRYSAPDLANKYKVSVSSVHAWRRKVYGKFNACLNTNKHLSSLELQMSKILDDLDIGYVPHKTIDKYNIDFYLGKKLCLEVDGQFHELPKRKLQDMEKDTSLTNLGYKIIRVHYSEFENLDTLRSRIEKEWVSHYRNIMKNNPVNPCKRGVPSIKGLSVKGCNVHPNTEPSLS